MKKNGNFITGNRAKRFLIILMSVVVAVAVGVTCALFVGGVPSKRMPVGDEADGSVGASATARTNPTTGTNFTTTLLYNGDTITYNDSTKVYSVTLPAGVYKLEVAGGAGGANGNGAAGGNGGYIKTGLTLKSSMTLYMYVGSKGGDASAATGGAGGKTAGTVKGGKGGKGTRSNGGGGGGARTYIALTSSCTNGDSSCSDHLLIEAGGGGGAGGASNGGSPGAGSAASYAGGAGGNGSGAVNAGNGGTSTAGNGTSGLGGAGATISEAGAGGAVQCPTKTSDKDGSYYPAGGGGGGAGYYSGGGGAGGSRYGNGAAAKGTAGTAGGANGVGGNGGNGASATTAYYSGVGGGGGGGSGYVKSGALSYNTNAVVGAVTVNNKYVTESVPAVTNASNNTGDGYVKITALEVNKDPETKATVKSLGTKARGSYTGVNLITFSASDIATDIAAGTTSVSGQTLSFSNGSASNLDTVSTANNGIPIYLNTTGTSASDYIAWKYNSSTEKIEISEIKRIPRANYSTGCTQNNLLTLYVYVRDNYGTQNNQRGYGLIKFTITVSETTTAYHSTTASTDSLNINKKTTNTLNKVRVGKSANLTTAPLSAETTSIYNPNGKDRYTAFVTGNMKVYNSAVQSTAALTDAISVQIQAADLITGLNSTYDTALISLDSTNGILSSNSSRAYKIRELDNETGYTSYKVTTARKNDTSGTYIPNAFKQITIVGMKSGSNYLVLPVTLYVVENTGARGTNYQTTYFTPISMEIVFKVTNARPMLSDMSNVPTVSLESLKTATVGFTGSNTVNLNSYIRDSDVATMTSSTHKIMSVVLPSSEFVQVDRTGKIATVSKSRNELYYNAIGGATYPSDSALTNAADTGMLGAGYETDFPSDIVTTGAANSDHAFIQYSYNQSALTILGLRASRSMYKSGRNGGKAIVAPGDANNTYARNPGHFYLLIRLQDLGDGDDTGIWLPIAIQVNDAAPTNLSSERGTTGASIMPTAEGTVSSEFVFSPMGITISGTTYALGSYKKDGALTNLNLQALASDADNFYTTTMTYGGKLNELVTITSTPSEVQSSVSNNTAGEFFTVTEESIYIPDTYFGDRVSSSTITQTENISGTTYRKIRGLKVTLKNWTNNRYFYAKVNVRDINGSANNSTNTIYIAVKVTNSAPKAAETDDVAQIDYTYNGTHVLTSYDKDTSTITYNIPVDSTVFITPYDILTDADMTRSGVSYPTNGFTLNGLTGVYKGITHTFVVGSATASAGELSVVGLANEKNAYNYGSTTYQGLLKTTLGKITGSRSYTSCIAAGNRFSSPSSNSSLGRDRLYFKRSSDAANLDGYTFDPYTQSNGENAAKFAMPTVSNGTYIDLNFGNTVRLDNIDYKIDFLAITGKSRMQVGMTSEFELEIRDRTGAGAAGDSYGVKKITVVVKVINSTPYVNDTSIKTVSTTAVTKTENGVTKVVTPTSLTISAVKTETKNGVQVFAEDSLLKDNEDISLTFFTEKGFRVLDENNSESDGIPYYDSGVLINEGKSYLGNYVDILFTADTLTITAVNSTQAKNTLYLEFYATDGRSVEEYSELKIRIEVLNSVMTINYGDDGFVKGSNDTNGLNLWVIDAINSTDAEASRYFAADSRAAAKFAADNNISSAKIKALTVDPDPLQGSILSPATISGTKVNYKLPSESTDKLKDFVPSIGVNDGAVQLKWRNGNAESVIGPTHEYVDYDACTIYYFDGSAWKTGSQVVTELGNLTFADINDATAKKYFDSKGRWNVTDWAVAVKPKKAFPSGQYLQLKVLLRDETVFGGDTAGKDTAFASGSAAVVNGYDSFSYHMTVKSPGIVTYSYYDQFGGYYTVADGVDSNKNYISTVKGATKGEHTGAEYENGNEYTYSDGEAAFRYSHTIKVDSNSNKKTYVPMSYFALRNGLVGKKNGNVEYSTKEYVAYDISSASYDRGNTLDITSAITVSDGKKSWSGNGESDGLNANPYVTVMAYDKNTGSGDEEYSNSLDSPYFNKNLAVSAKEIKQGDINPTNTYENEDDYDAEGNILYLTQQRNFLQEHLFGISIAKNETRASSANLTISINVALCQIDGSKTKTNYGIGSTETEKKEDREKKTATVVFNLEVGNSKLTLAPDGDTSTSKHKIYGDATNGYYTSIELYNGGDSFGYTFGRSEADSDNNKTIRFIDSDYSDEAYFFADSTKKLDSWVGGEDVCRRAKDYSVGNYTYTAADPIAQKSVAKYFADKGGNADGSFQPNGGKYGSNNGTYNVSTHSGDGTEGYSSYFNVSVTDGGSKLTITPLAKTVLNSSVSETDYAERGLIVSEKTSGRVTKAYYPLRVLVYDSCGDGWNSASYVALEIRVCVLNATPMLKSSLKEAKGVEGIDSNIAETGDKAVEISLAVGSDYNLNVNDLISDSDLLVSGNNSYWNVPTDASAFKKETGDVFQSPFMTNGVTSSADLTAANTALRSGSLKFFDKNNTVKSQQPDVVMWMNYGGDSLTADSVPSDNYIRITVNRRTTYKDGNNVITKSRFIFSLQFMDNSGIATAKTKRLYIVVNISNSTPTIRLADVTSNVTMRVHDHFTLLTTPYDFFNGTHDEINAKDSADASYTYSNYAAGTRGFLGSANEYLAGTGGYPSYPSLTAAALGTQRYKLRNSRTDEAANANLGYSAIAKDDTPWSLRIQNVSLGDDGDKFSCFFRDEVAMEGNHDESGFLSVNIIANKVCSNARLVVTLTDGEIANAITYTMYITVTSSKPAPISSVEIGANTQTLNTGLALHYDAESEMDSTGYSYRTDSNGQVVSVNGKVEAMGVYDLYMVASDGDNSTSKSREVNISDYGATRKVRAYESLTVSVEQVAYDLDSEDDANIGLFRSGARFALNGFSMNNVPNNTSVYANDKFRIEILDAFETQFKITCLSFDAYSDCDELSFYVRDDGNQIMDNAVKIVIRICTLYSAVTNRHAVQNAQPDGNNYYTSYAESINVKSYDDYVGNSVDIDVRDPAGPNGERKIIGNPSTYQFLKYAGKEDSVDQTADGFISDPDVISETTNLNYDVKVYAFIDIANDTFTCKTPADVTKKYIEVGATRNNPTNYFRIAQEYKTNQAKIDELNQYLVGGKQVTGSSYDNVLNRELLAYVNNYFMFSIGSDGVSLTFTPVTANLKANILFYVEIEKDIDHGRMVYPTAATAISGGSLFYVQVENSTPIANDDPDTVSARSFTGKVNEYTFFPIFDKDNPVSSMFSDSDVEDVVKIRGHETGTNNADYVSAFSVADANLDWRSGNGKARAIDIVANNNDTVKTYRKNNKDISIPAHSLLIYINRRIDVKDAQNNYSESVSFDLSFVGEDSKKAVASSELHITIVNSDISVRDTALASKLDKNGVGYTLSRGADKYSYVLDTFVTKDSDPVEISVFSWLYDPDNPNNNVVTDEDSYRLVKNEDEHKSDYITDGVFEVSTVIGTSKTRLAYITPTFKDNDKNHFMSITVTPDSYLRDHTGTAYMQILDRSGSGIADNGSHGVFITVNVTILNSAPTVNPDRITEYSLIGSNSQTLPQTVIDINDFVSDPNDTDRPSQAGKTETYLRIVGVDVLLPESMTSTAVDSVQNNLISVSYDPNDAYNIKCLIQPQTGFYGSQSVVITVSDGSEYDPSARQEQFTVKFKISYNFADITQLNDVTALRGMTTRLTPELLVSEIDNTYVAGSKNASRVRRASDSGVSVSADEQESSYPKFNPGADYVVSKVTVPASYTDYVRVSENDGTWQFRAMRLTTQGDIELSAEFMLATDVGKENAVAYPATFKVHIDENPKPELIDAFKNGYTFYKSGEGYLLNDDGVVNLTPDKMFTDNKGDILKFVSAKSKIPSLVDVKVTAEDNLEIHFFANGKAEITVEVADTTDEPKSFTFTIINIDMPDPSFWQSIVISFESHTWVWIGILGAVILAIIILIIVIIAIKHRKRKREELEAILLSEMELEEQMMRLAAPGATAYQSYGYLPPTVNAQQDPNMLLGTGSGFDPLNNAIGLNPGASPAQQTPITNQPQTGSVNYGGGIASGGNNGVPQDSDM